MTCSVVFDIRFIISNTIPIKSIILRRLLQALLSLKCQIPVYPRDILIGCNWLNTITQAPLNNKKTKSISGKKSWQQRRSYLDA